MTLKAKEGGPLHFRIKAKEGKYSIDKKEKFGSLEELVRHYMKTSLSRWRKLFLIKPLGNKERHSQVSAMLCQKVKRNVDTVEVKTQGAGNLEHCVELLKNDQN